MNYLSVEASLQAIFSANIPLSPAQTGRIAIVCNALMLAGEVHLTKIARFIKGQTQQDSRVRWIKRLLDADFMTQERVYQPLLKHALSRFRDTYWHLVIDRTTLWDGEIDLATISLQFRKRAIPLVWCHVPFGGAPASTYVELLHRCVPLIPHRASVVFHGDTEFGGSEMIRALRQLEWDFILGQESKWHFYRSLTAPSAPFASLPVTHRQSCQLAQVELFAEHRLGGINILAFYQTHYTQAGKCKRRVCYLATSLPLDASVRRLGRRRWGTEPFYRDYKSAGWHVTWSQLDTAQRQEGLLILLAIAYLWSVCIGRWLCKIGQRCQVDAHPIRHLSLFRIGWDWLIHQLISGYPIPSRLRLYT
jgi:hypothetical protein